MSIREHSRLAWPAVSFLRLWNIWLMISGFKTETSFISDQTYRDSILSGHSIIFSMKLYSIYFPNQPYHPWIFGSNACKDHFAALRGFCRNKSNLCMLDMIDLSGHIQKLKELKLEERCFPDAYTSGWNYIDKEILEGMNCADKEVLKTIELLGMLPNLLKGNVLRQEGDKLISLNRVWIDSDEFMSDEKKVVSLEELAELDNDILLDSLDNLNENYNYLPFTDLAATVSSATDSDGGDTWKESSGRSIKTRLGDRRIRRKVTKTTDVTHGNPGERSSRQVHGKLRRTLVEH